jgi:hypothetical protein
MAAGRHHGHAALGFAVHTGWAAMVAVSGPATSAAVLDRRRLEMIPGSERRHPRFVYHAARELSLEFAERFIRECADLSCANAKEALRVAIEDLGKRGYEVVAGSIIIGNRPLTAPLESILKNHSLVHTAEGELFRATIRSAGQALGVPVNEVRANELSSRAAAALGVSESRAERHLAGIGRAAGKPWAKDQRDACLAALIALAARWARPSPPPPPPAPRGGGR